MKYFATIAWLALWGASPAEAVSFQDFQSLSENSKQAFLRGAEEAYGFANATLSEDGVARLYCVPQGTAHSIDDLSALVRGYTIRNSFALELPVSLILLSAMQEAYPCYFEPKS